MSSESTIASTTQSGLTSADSKGLPFIVWSIVFWVLISVGRPQDIFPSIAILHLGMIAACLTTLLLITADYKLKKTFLSPFATRDGKLMIALIAFMAVFGAIGVYPRLSMEFLLGFWKIAYFYFAFRAIITSKERIVKVVWCLIFSAGLMGLANSLQAVGIAATERLSVGGTYDPNDLGLMIVTCLPFSLYFFISYSGWRKLFAGGCMLASLTGLALTQSRGALLGLSVQTAFIILRDTGFPGRFRKLAVVAIVGVFFYAVMPSNYFERVEGALDQRGTGMGRLRLWKNSVDLAMDKPLLGTGVATFVHAYGMALINGRIIPNKDSSAPYAWRVAHSSYVTVLVELGLLGTLLYLSLMGVSIFGLRKINSERKVHPWDPEGDICLYASMTEIGFCGYLVSATFLSQSYSALFFLLVGLAGAIRSVADEQKAEYPGASCSVNDRQGSHDT